MDDVGEGAELLLETVQSVGAQRREQLGGGDFLTTHLIMGAEDAPGGPSAEEFDQPIALELEVGNRLGRRGTGWLR